MAEGRIRNRKLRRQGGSGLLESILTLGVAAIATMSIVGFVEESTNHIKQQVASQQLRAVHGALRGYIGQHVSATGGVLGSGEAVTIPISTLRTGYWLPPWFTTTNVYGQTYRLGVRRQANNSAIGFVGFSQPGTFPGDPEKSDSCTQPPEKAARQIAAAAGADGGWVRTSNRDATAEEIASGLPATIAAGYGEGAFGSWRAGIDIANGLFTGGGNGFTRDQVPQQGCMMALIFVRP